MRAMHGMRLTPSGQTYNNPASAMPLSIFSLLGGKISWKFETLGVGPYELC